MAQSRLETVLRASIGVLLILFVYVIYDSFRERIVNVGDRAPAFTITADNGQPVSLDDHGGKLLVLNFWATWCPPCVDELPSLERFSRLVAPQGIKVVAISVDKDAKVYRDFLARNPVSFVTARDPETKINVEYGTVKFPETYVIKDGKVLRKFISSQLWDDERMLADIRSLL